MIEPSPPLDWIPEAFREQMRARDEHGVLHKIDWSVPGGRWVPLELQMKIAAWQPIAPEPNGIDDSHIADGLPVKAGESHGTD